MEEVVVLGGGIAGLETALRAEKKGFKVKLVEPRDSMLFYPSVHELMMGSEEEKVTIDYERKFEDREIEHVQAKAESIDFEDNSVKIRDDPVEFDYLVIATGFETRLYGIPGAEKAYTLRDIKDPQEIYRKISNGAKSVAVVGGGTTGVESTSSLLELRKEYDFDLTLVHGDERLLPNNNPGLGREVEKSMREKDVDLKLDARAVQVNESSIELESGETIDADIILWAGGIQPTEFVQQLSLETDFGGIKVDKHMRTDRENVFAVGDNCSYEGKVNRALYGLFEAKTVAQNISRASDGRDLVERDILYDPQIVYLGKLDAALKFGDYYIRGIIPSLMRSIGIEKRYMWVRKYWM